jgi:hypothetical protein
MDRRLLLVNRKTAMKLPGITANGLLDPRPIDCRAPESLISSGPRIGGL